MTIKVMVIDDSAVVRQAMTQVIEQFSDMRVIATAQDPIVAAQKMRKEAPDVITLDIEMPRMDGLTFLRKLMHQHPLPVIICSSLTGSGTQTAIQALELGAVDIITKPELGTKGFIQESAARIADCIRAAAASRVHSRRPSKQVQAKLSADAMIKVPMGATALPETTEKVIAIGASTGGTEAIRCVLEAMPVDCPGIVIVQHMPENFTRSFAERLNQCCKIVVKEAKNNDTVLRGQALIAPGNKHMLLKRSGARYYVEVKDGPLVSRHRPSVDVLFRSVALHAGQNSRVAILTGMGDDGAKGMKELADAGAITVAQDEATSVVFGMPREAIRIGGAKHTLPLSDIAGFLLRRRIAAAS